MNDQEVEKEIVAKGKTAPRVTIDHIENIITSESYFTALEGVEGEYARAKREGWASSNNPIELDDSNQLGLLTFCVLVLENGFTVTGESACASPENFDWEIGRKIARQNAVNKIWLLEGYLLKQKLYDEQ